MGLVHNRITDWDARRDEFHYVLLKTTCTSSFWAKFKKSKLKKASELKKEKKISARRRELLERGTNINFFLHWFFSTCATDFAEKERLLLSPVTLNKNPVVCFWNVHTGLNSLSSLNSNMKEKNQFFSKVSHYHVDRTLSNKIFDRFWSPFSSRDRIICQNLAFKMLRESINLFEKLLLTIYSF